jgi:hypothetical protein
MTGIAIRDDRIVDGGSARAARSTRAVGPKSGKPARNV